MPRILLVEDDAEVRLLVEHVLLAAGYGVEACENFETGSELLESRDYDLIIADGRLSDGTGMRLADEARRRGIAALIITGYAFVLQELNARRGQYDVLLKPITPEELLAGVENALASRS
jgi:OmpR-family two-component system manganese-sensing response regulator